MRNSLIAFLSAAAIFAFTDLASAAEDAGPNAAALAKALGQASVTLQQGLKVREREGIPISGKYELEEDALQLSVYTMKGDQFVEVIVDHKSGAIKKTEAITDADDLKAAKDQSEAMAQAKVPLDQAVETVVKDASCCYRGNYRAVSAVPALKAEEPVVEITLMGGEEVKKVTKKLD